MTLIPVGAFLAQAVFNTPSPGSPAMVVTGHLGTFSGSPDEEAEIIAEEVWGGAGSFMPRIDIQTVLSQVNVYRNTGGPDLAVGQWNGTIPGSAPSGQAIPQVAVLIQKQSGLAGRRNKGRMYVPGILAQQVGDDGLIDGGTLTNWQAAADSFLSLCSSENVDLVILHSSPPDTATPVVSLSVQALVATQRRRIR